MFLTLSTLVKFGLEDHQSEAYCDHFWGGCNFRQHQGCDFWMQWANTRALQILTWLLSESTLAVMVIRSFKAFGLGWLLKQNSKLAHFLLVCIAWHIKPILLSWFWANYPWLCTLKVCYSPCMPFFHIVKKRC